METPSRILLVDDDRDIRTLLGEQLTAAGFQVETAGDGARMREVMAAWTPDLVLLDLNLPREDGLKLCRDIRATSTTPIIMLTARGEPVDRILGLEMGADDYLTKPFEPRELIARIRNVLRRTQALPANLAPLEARRALINDWTLDIEQRLLNDPGGRVVMLSGAEFRLLRVLIDYANRVLSREQLINLGAVRQEDALDRAVDIQVSRLRQKFGDDGAVLIRTIRNEGYVLAATVTLA
ncbi:response regulator transcription factor [Brevundimonas sp.]|jgi:two-component system, OmpR family, response regulator|uniref:response regulator n=1 Tax=Brevundimonas sp. TaxID=1871086 RepID=UPI00180D8610|nr:response regulator transcription factor [Brevundimonas sp.]MBA4807773.1 response regulator transcription factor [Brevundimonas sp.]